MNLSANAGVKMAQLEAAIVRTEPPDPASPYNFERVHCPHCQGFFWRSRQGVLSAWHANPIVRAWKKLLIRIKS